MIHDSFRLVHEQRRLQHNHNGPGKLRRFRRWIRRMRQRIIRQAARPTELKRLQYCIPFGWSSVDDRVEARLAEMCERRLYREYWESLPLSLLRRPVLTTGISFLLKSLFPATSLMYNGCFYVFNIFYSLRDCSLSLRYAPMSWTRVYLSQSSELGCLYPPSRAFFMVFIIHSAARDER